MLANDNKLETLNGKAIQYHMRIETSKLQHCAVCASTHMCVLIVGCLPETLFYFILFYFILFYFILLLHMPSCF